MRYLLIIGLFLSAHLCFSQSETTQHLHKENEDAFYLFFYKNTLHMVNQGDNNEEFAKIIKEIDRMKFLRIDKEDNFSREDIQSLMDKYEEEEFEEMMSMRNEGNDMKVYIKERDNVTLGLVMLINEEEALSILDIAGSVPLDEVMNIYNHVKTLNK